MQAKQAKAGAAVLALCAFLLLGCDNTAGGEEAPPGETQQQTAETENKDEDSGAYDDNSGVDTDQDDDAQGNDQ